MIAYQIIFLLLAYLMGAIPFGLWIGEIFFHKNLHQYGSGNTGTTNTFRVLGTKAGIVVFIFDLLKGTLAVLLPTIFALHGITPLVYGLLAVLGHTVSVFDHFKGGKAVATSGGVVLGYNPSFLIYLLIIFIIILLLFSMISLASIMTAFAALIGVFVFPAFHFILLHYDLLFALAIVIFAVIILIRHRSNIQRILHKDENIVHFGLNLSRQKNA